MTDHHPVAIDYFFAGAAGVAGADTAGLAAGAGAFAGFTRLYPATIATSTTAAMMMFVFVNKFFICVSPLLMSIL